MGLIYQTEFIPKPFVHKKCGIHESPVKKKKSYLTRAPESGQMFMPNHFLFTLPNAHPIHLFCNLSPDLSLFRLLCC